MTEVLFYHLQNMSLENVLPPLLEKSLERGWRVVVQSTSQERADALDAHLWTYRDDSFLPHATWRAGDAAGSADRAGDGGGQSESGQCPVSDRQRRAAGGLRQLERMVLVFNGDDGEALAAARERLDGLQGAGVRGDLLAGRRARPLAAAAIAISGN